MTLNSKHPLRKLARVGPPNLEVALMTMLWDLTVATFELDRCPLYIVGRNGSFHRVVSTSPMVHRRYNRPTAQAMYRDGHRKSLVYLASKPATATISIPRKLNATYGIA